MKGNFFAFAFDFMFFKGLAETPSLAETSASASEQPLVCGIEQGNVDEFIVWLDALLSKHKKNCMYKSNVAKAIARLRLIGITGGAVLGAGVSPSIFGLAAGAIAGHDTNCVLSPFLLSFLGCKPDQMLEQIGKYKTPARLMVISLALILFGEALIQVSGLVSPRKSGRGSLELSLLKGLSAKKLECWVTGHYMSVAGKANRGCVKKIVAASHGLRNGMIGLQEAEPKQFELVIQALGIAGDFLLSALRVSKAAQELMVSPIAEAAAEKAPSFR